MCTVQFHVRLMLTGECASECCLNAAPYACVFQSPIANTGTFAAVGQKTITWCWVNKDWCGTQRVVTEMHQTYHLKSYDWCTLAAINNKCVYISFYISDPGPVLTLHWSKLNFEIFFTASLQNNLSNMRSGRETDFSSLLWVANLT